jgi:flagellar basal-body rod modification protein FlgD
MASSSVASTLAQNSPATSPSVSTNSLGSLTPNDFLKMLLSELQNQDPLSPMDSGQMLTQIGQISQVSSTQTLTTTLNSMLLGQNVNNATALIGKTIDGISDKGSEITGTVDKVTISNNQPVLNIGSDTVQLSNVKSVLPDTGDTTVQDTAATANNTAIAASQLQQLLQLFQQSQQSTGSSSGATSGTPPAAAAS